MDDDLFPGHRWDANTTLATISSSARLSPKQQAILSALRGLGEITLDQAVNLIGGNIYHNQSKHVGALLANMVRRGYIRRRARGKFTLP